MPNINYKLLQDMEIDTVVTSGEKPKLLLHACCAPCASHVLELLSKHFLITALFYNPNIYPLDEYKKRENELRRLLGTVSYKNTVSILECTYDSAGFERAAAKFSEEPEGGARCGVCFMTRLEETAKKAKEGGFSYFTTTLTVSPHKNARFINETGENLMQKYGVRFLFSDFKKKDGYKRSIEISRLHNIYRQTYCGCRYSLSHNPNLHN